jgi:glycine cleavage system H protein
VLFGKEGIAMEIEGYHFPDDLHYDKEHYWCRVEGNVVVMGTTDFAQKMAGEIVYVQLPLIGKSVNQGKPCGALESGKWVGRVYAAISGKVVEVNEALEDSPELINQSPYDQGWMVKIEPANLEEELKNLMQGDDLIQFVKSEIVRVAAEK